MGLFILVDRKDMEEDSLKGHTRQRWMESGEGGKDDGLNLYKKSLTTSDFSGIKHQ